MDHIKTKVEIPVLNSELPIRIETTEVPGIVSVNAVVFDGDVQLNDLLVAITKLKIDSYELLPQILEDDAWGLDK